MILLEGVTQIAYLTPVAYLETRERFEAIPVALPLTKGQSTVRLAVAVGKASPAQILQDLAGRSCAFGDEKSLLQRAILEAGCFIANQRTPSAQGGVVKEP